MEDGEIKIEFTEAVKRELEGVKAIVDSSQARTVAALEHIGAGRKDKFEDLVASLVRVRLAIWAGGLGLQSATLEFTTGDGDKLTFDVGPGRDGEGGGAPVSVIEPVAARLQEAHVALRGIEEATRANVDRSAVRAREKIEEATTLLRSQTEGE